MKDGIEGHAANDVAHTDMHKHRDTGTHTHTHTHKAGMNQPS